MPKCSTSRRLSLLTGFWSHLLIYFSISRKCLNFSGNKTMKSVNAFPVSYSGSLNVLCLWANHEHSSVVTEMRTWTCASPVRPRKDVSSRDPSLFNIYCCPETLPNCFLNYPSISSFTSCLIRLCTQLLVLSWIVA